MCSSLNTELMYMFSFLLPSPLADPFSTSLPVFWALLMCETLKKKKVKICSLSVVILQSIGGQKHVKRCIQFNRWLQQGHAWSAMFLTSTSVPGIHSLCFRLPDPDILLSFKPQLTFIILSHNYTYSVIPFYLNHSCDLLSISEEPIKMHSIWHHLQSLIFGIWGGPWEFSL